MGKFYVKLKKQNKRGLVWFQTCLWGPVLFPQVQKVGSIVQRTAIAQVPKSQRAFLIQMRIVLWKYKGQEYLHSPYARAGIRGGCFLRLVSQEIRSGRQATLWCWCEMAHSQPRLENVSSGSRYTSNPSSWESLSHPTYIGFHGNFEQRIMSPCGSYKQKPSLSRNSVFWSYSTTCLRNRDIYWEESCLFFCVDRPRLSGPPSSGNLSWPLQPHWSLPPR